MSFIDCSTWGGRRMKKILLPICFITRPNIHCLNCEYLLKFWQPSYTLKCHKEGHNRTTCPHLAHIREGERKIKIQQQFHFYLRMITFSIFIFIILKFEID